MATLLRDYQKQVEAALTGLPGGGRAFMVMSLVQRETCQSQIAIAERIALDKTTLTYLLDGLEKEDLIRRVSDPNDRRSRHINLTPKGAKALVGFSQAVEHIEEGILARLDPKDAALFRVSLSKAAGLEAVSEESRAEQTDSAHICKTVVSADEAC
ncbi:MarR family winged helix-turn-helix transcriptional regulator [Devosia chinhatensis]|uniref:MarR family winged helix-turn-helix transcriptional regulator n=1 Tax=Devosia chinhatensis TaxID=429727 RepID=UPI000697F924|nr:MarR family transcriptional regulator [Devosia chinhatensis]